MESDTKQTYLHDLQEGNQSHGWIHKGPDDVDFLVWSIFIQYIFQCIVECDKRLTRTSASITKDRLSFRICFEELLLILCKWFNVNEEVRIDRFLPFQLFSGHANTNWVLRFSLSRWHRLRSFLLVIQVLVKVFSSTSFQPGFLETSLFLQSPTSVDP